jgi:2-methylcitrate dehydratase
LSASSVNIPFDPLITEIAEYVEGYAVRSDAAFDMARHCLMDSLACALEALDHPSCVNLLGPVVPGVTVTHGARVPGTSFLLDPATAAFNIGAMVRWLDFSDTWVTTPTTSHPSDDVGAILAVADYASRVRTAGGKPPLVMKDVLEAMIKAHEIQGVLGGELAITEHGVDHPFLAKLAVAGVVAKLLGTTREQIANAVSLAFFDVSLCVHRYGSNTGPRKGWAAADATSQGVRLALMAAKGEPGYPQAFSHPKWGFAKSFLGGEMPKRATPFTTGVMENVFFKLLVPVVIHAQSSIECALDLHPRVKDRLEDIAAIQVATHRITMEKIVKTGPLRNSADRDHCLQYAIAVALLHGRLTAADYEDEAAADPRIDRLRALMTVTENPRYTEMYKDRAVRANSNAIEVRFKDGSTTGLIEALYPIGHSSRRKEGLPILVKKFEQRVARRFPQRKGEIGALCLDHKRLVAMPVHLFSDLLVAEQ